MKAMKKVLLSCLVVLALVATMVIAQPASATTATYGSANLPAGVQEQIAAAAQLRENAAAFVQQGFCPLCNTQVEWVKAEENTKRSIIIW